MPPILSKLEDKTANLKMHRNFDPSAIDKIAEKFRRRIAAHISKIQPDSGRHEYDFSVVIKGNQIRLDSGPVYPVGAKAKGKHQFDPEQAGREVVAQLQNGEGGAWSGQELAARFKLTPAALHKRRKEHRIVAWRDAMHHFHYPTWQFTPVGALLPGVRDVLQTFRSLDEWRVIRYFLAPRHQLDDRSPLDLLRAGEVDRVVAHAKSDAEENSW